MDRTMTEQFTVAESFCARSFFETKSHQASLKQIGDVKKLIIIIIDLYRTRQHEEPTKNKVMHTRTLK